MLNIMNIIEIMRLTDAVYECDILDRGQNYPATAHPGGIFLYLIQINTCILSIFLCYNSYKG